MGTAVNDQMAPCSKCGRNLPLADMRPVANLALRPGPHWQKVPGCLNCYPKRNVTPLIWMNLVLFAVAAIRVGSLTVAIWGLIAVVILVGPVVWRVRRIVRPEVPYTLTNKPWVESPLAKGPWAKELPWWQAGLAVVVAMTILMLFLAALSKALGFE